MRSPQPLRSLSESDDDRNQLVDGREVLHFPLPQENSEKCENGCHKECLNCAYPRLRRSAGFHHAPQQVISSSLQYAQERGKVGFFLMGQTHAESNVVELHCILQGRG